MHKNNIVIIGSLLIGSKLDEEEKDTEQLIENVKKLGIDIPVYNIMTPLPGTKFRETLIEKGYLISRNWNEYNFLTAVNRLNNLSKEQLEYLLSKAYYYGYFNRSWKATFIKIARRKGLQLFIRPGKSIKAIREFLSFFGTIRRLKHKIESPGNSSNVITFHD